MLNLLELASYDAQGNLRVVVESPRGSRAKLKYEPGCRAFEVSRSLALGLAYPYDWGFVPSTRAPDGDPIDAMIMHDIATYPGVIVACRPIGVVRVSQKEPGTPRRDNDRLVAVPAADARYKDVRKLDEEVRNQLEQFFRLAVLGTEKKVDIRGWKGPKYAASFVEDGRRAYDRSRAMT